MTGRPAPCAGCGESARLRLEDLDYSLPPDRIAQAPAEDRASARILVARRGTAGVEHRTVRDLPRLLPPRTLVVFNDTRVIRARLLGDRAATGGRVELLLVRCEGSRGGRTERWSALLSTRGRVVAGETLRFGSLEAELVDRRGRDEVLVDLRATGACGDVGLGIAREGLVPLPPYIRRSPGPADDDRYQTVFAKVPGAVAAPTAGLHFTPGLLDELRAAGHEIAFVTLHVGPATFRPIETARLDDHPMHAERMDLPGGTAEAIRRARAGRRAVLAVGTTVVRAIETAAAAGREAAGPGAPRPVSAFGGDTSLYVLPGHRFAAVDAVLTNFHLPRTTLLALVMAFHGVAETRSAYDEAVRAGYRFYSYGDAMLVLPAEAS